MYGNQNPIKYVDPSGENGVNAGAILGSSWGIAGGAAASDTVLPFGDIIGLAIGIGGTIIAGGVAIFNKIYYTKDKETETSLPTIGEPNSSKDLLNPDGTVKQKRYYGPDGRAEKDIDYNHSNGDGSHTFPHTHEWDWSSGKGVRK